MSSLILLANKRCRFIARQLFRSPLSRSYGRGAGLGTGGAGRGLSDPSLMYRGGGPGGGVGGWGDPTGGVGDGVGNGSGRGGMSKPQRGSFFFENDSLMSRGGGGIGLSGAAV